MKYQVKTDAFQGPLELLLSLIEKRKLLINDISLAVVADDYMLYMKGLSHFPVKEAAHFLLIASTLVLIKSKSLLPALTLTEEEEGSIEDLEKRLRLYQRIRALGNKHVRTMFGAERIFPRRVIKNTVIVFSPDAKATLPVLLSAMRQVIVALPRKEVLPETVVKKIISLEEMIMSLSARIEKSLKLNFSEFSRKGKEEKVHVIVSFLAMLELVKQGAIEVTQERNFADISMESRNLNVPSYQ